MLGFYKYSLCIEYSSSKNKHLFSFYLLCTVWTQFSYTCLFCRSGWKRSRDGSWVKDENAEFDSDEDVPDVLSHSV